jgi:Uma2 family endonuclease
MPQVLDTSQTSTREIYYPSGTDDDEIIYHEQRADDMGESSFHNNLRIDVFAVLDLFLKNRTDVFMTANMNIYHIRGNPDEWFAPDILISFGVPNYERSIYKLWEEKIFPQVIFEISSDRTWKTDVADKLKLYEQLGAEEYYILDSEHGKYLSAPMLAFHRQGERLLSVPIADDRIFSPRLGLEIVRTKNTFRLFNLSTNEFLLTLEERANEVERLKVEK